MSNPQPVRAASQTSRQTFRDSTLYYALTVLLANWKPITALAVMGFVVGVGLSFLFAPRYRATGRVALPPSQARPNLSFTSSLPAILGLSLRSGNFSPEFIAALAGGRNVVDSVLTISVASVVDSPATLAAYLADEDAIDRSSRTKAREAFTRRFVADLDVRTGMVEMSFWDQEPAVAVAALRALMTETNEQLSAFQRTFAVARRDYLQERVAESYERLSSQEQELAHFRETNRDVRNSPLLQLEGERLNRRVDMALGEYRALQEQLDAAELEVRSDIPQLMVVEDPEVPVHKFFPKRRYFALGFAFLGVVVFALWSVARPRLAASFGGAGGAP